MIRYTCLAGLLCCLQPFPAHAIVNVEVMRGDEATEGFSGRIGFDINGTSGNSDVFSAGVGNHLQWHNEKITDLVILDYDYGESNGERNTNKGFLHLRHVVQVQKRWAVEGFAQIEKDEFTRLTLRELLGGGLRLTLMNSPSGMLHLGMGAFYSVERIQQDAATSDDGTDNFWRANIYLGVQHRFNEQTRVVSTTYLQPVINDLSDYRLLEEGALKVKLADNLGLKVALVITRDNAPPQAVEKTDITFSTGIEYLF